MLSESLTKVHKPCYVIPTACHNLRSAALRWCVRKLCPDIFCREAIKTLLNFFAMDSKELSSITDCFGDQKAIKTPKLSATLCKMAMKLSG